VFRPARAEIIYLDDCCSMLFDAAGDRNPPMSIVLPENPGIPTGVFLYLAGANERSIFVA